MDLLDLILKPCNQFLFNHQSFSPSGPHSCCNSKAAQCGLLRRRQHTSIMACMPSCQRTPATAGKGEGSKCKEVKGTAPGQEDASWACSVSKGYGNESSTKELLVCWDHIAILDPNQALPSSSKQGLGPRPSVCPLETFVKRSTFIRNVIWYILPISVFFFKKINPGIMEFSVDNCNNLYIQYLSNLMSKRENKVRLTWDLH